MCCGGTVVSTVDTVCCNDVTYSTLSGYECCGTSYEQENSTLCCIARNGVEKVSLFLNTLNIYTSCYLKSGRKWEVAIRERSPNTTATTVLITLVNEF